MPQLRYLRDALLLGSLAFFSYLLLKITLQYRNLDTDIGFLRIKQQYLHLDYWLFAFFLHVFTSMPVLLAGFSQFSRYIRHRIPVIHRWVGYIYILDIIFLTAPAGFIMGIHANGGITSRFAFCILATLWWLTTFRAWQAARQKDWITHRNFMWRSYALTLSAVTLRLWKWVVVFIGVHFLDYHISPKLLYQIVAWVGFVPNLIFAEWLIYATKRAKNMTY